MAAVLLSFFAASVAGAIGLGIASARRRKQRKKWRRKWGSPWGRPPA